MPKTNRSSRTLRAFRQRLRPPAARRCCFSCRARRWHYLDAIKERQGLRNRSQALLQLIEQGRAAAQQTT